MNRYRSRVLTLALFGLCLLPAACVQSPEAQPAAGAQGDFAQEAGVAPEPASAGSAATSWPMATDASVPAPAMVATGAAAGGGMQRVAVIDPNGFGQPMPALWVQLPAGWRTTGGVLWNQQAPCGATPSFQWQAQSPDGRQSLQMLPAEAWTYDNLNMPMPAGSCPRWPITDVRTYLQSLVQRQRPNARVLDYRTRNDLIQRAPPPSDAQTRYWKEGGELLIAYSGPNGEVRESFSAVVQFMETTMQGVVPGEVRKFISGIAGSPLIASAPAGQLDLAMVTRFGTSAVPDPQWQARMDKHNTAIARQGLQGQSERGQIMADTQREIADINQAGWERRDASGDAMQRQTVDGINNVERYTDPVTGSEVQMDNRYDNAWRANDGTYFQSNDPNLNPQVDLGIEAEQMERNE
ncbi:MAG: hypothetical protein DCF27_10000 [Lysobacteraceae bacterium]|nr:MAG: hypothetical protein DCF27_10000 [Xanthomonadaceae bacterium]